MRAQAIKFITAAAIACMASTAAQAQKLLEPEDAFKVQAQQVSPTEVDFTYKMAPGFMLYRDRFSVVTSGGTARVKDIIIPPGMKKFDKAMGQELEMYRDSVTVRVTVAPGQGSPGTLVASAQGCAVEQGLCYPPFTKAWVMRPIDIENFSGAGCPASGKKLATTTAPPERKPVGQC